MQISPIEVLTHYLLPVLVVAVLTNVPRFLEVEHVWDIVEKTVEDPFTGAYYKVRLFCVASGVWSRLEKGLTCFCSL